MNITRVVPDIHSKRFDESRAFYADFLGMKLAMDMGVPTLTGERRGAIHEDAIVGL